MDRLTLLEQAEGQLVDVIRRLDEAEMDVLTNCPPWTVRRLASHVLKNQLFWAGSVTGPAADGARRVDGRRSVRRRPRARSPPTSPRGCWSCGAPTA